MNFGGIELGGKLGGWKIINHNATSLPQDLASVDFNKLGARFDPIWVVASQVVNGTNYLLICRKTASDLGASQSIVGLIVNIPPGDIGGKNARVIEVIEDTELVEGTNPDDKVKQYLDSILKPNGEIICGVGISYVLYMGHKVTKGINHIVFAERRMATLHAVPEAMLIEFNVFEGKASLYRMEVVG